MHLKWNCNIYICMQKHSQYNNDERTHFFRKIYTLFEMVAKGLRKCYVGDWTKTATYWPPVLPSLAALLFSFCWTAQQGALRAQPSVKSWLSLPRTATTDSKLTISLFDLRLLPVSVASAPNSARPQSRLYPDISDQMHLFLDWRLGRRSICYKISNTISDFINSSWYFRTVEILRVIKVVIFPLSLKSSESKWSA